jgi:glycosyltransferase involved in cell wall biosynthesis
LFRNRVSVLIATYNRPDELASCLRAVRMNAGQLDVEVCVVNDGGNSIEPVVQQFPDLNIHFLNLPTNKGQVYCRNLALRMATGEWISICDDDDRLLPGHLYHMFEIAAKTKDNHPFLFSDVELVVRSAKGSQDRIVARKPFAWDHIDDLLKKYNPVVPSSVFYHRSLHDVAGEFDEMAGHYWDWDFWLRVQPFTEFVRIPGCSVLYGIDEGGGNQSSNPENMRNFLDRLVQKHGLGQLPSSNFLLMTEDPLLKMFRAATSFLWDGDMQVWK